MKYMRWKTSVLPRIAAFFPDSRELFGNESNKKKTYRTQTRIVASSVYFFQYRGRGDFQ